MDAQTLRNTVPHDLSERIRSVRGGLDSTVADGEFVLLWLHNALRVDDNPAVNVAVLAANELDQPLLIYQGVSERYPFASDRHHAFILQGAADLSRQCEAAGLPYVCHVERNADRRPHLKTLAARASLVVTDDIPTAPAAGWIECVADASPAPVWAVDASCVVPMTLTKKAYERAFAFRNATKKLRKARIDSEWIVPELWHSADPRDLVEFQPVDVGTCDLAALIGECDIDHGVAPVPHTLGGTTAARERWREFRGRPLEQYAARRNDALTDGVSRMSAYLHYGMISAFELARDALDAGAGGEKYLDELLIWRELAWHYCAHTSDHETVAALPDWAVDTLRAHERDPRPALYGWETLARGETGDPLWDAAQKSLLIQGELHNNVRMTWGKALLDWTESAAECLAMLIDLNHRYALDGRDPSSYGGLLWCLGQFDRPFAPEQPVLGTVRPRDTATHARRLPPEKYLERTTRPLIKPCPTVAVIGGGLCGLTAARTLHDHGFDVTVFDRGRTVGGRASSRDRMDEPTWDYGASVIEPKSERFRHVVRSWERDGLIRRWRPLRASITSLGLEAHDVTGTELYVGMPSINGVAQSLANGLNVQSGCTVESLSSRGGHLGVEWVTADDSSDSREFDHVVLAMPVEQAQRLLPEQFELPLASRPAHVAMVSLETHSAIGADRITVEDSPVELITHESAKPGRSGDEDRWVVQTTSDWSATRLDLAREGLAKELRPVVAELLGVNQASITSIHVHRWTYAFPAEPIAVGAIQAGRALVTGDWARGSTVEGAFLAGIDAAGVILRTCLIPAPKQTPATSPH